MIPDPIKHIENVAQGTTNFMGKQTQGVLERYPLLFSFLVVFGVVALMHGFDAIIEYIPYLNDHPAIVFLIGLVILVATGSLYKRLDKKIG